MTRARCIAGVLSLLIGLGCAAQATGLGFAVGMDPTGILLFSALTEMPLSENFDLRAEVGIATGDMAGLMLITGGLVAHQVFEPVDPFFALGAGVALTPPPFTTGLVLEGTAGLRVVPIDALVVFAQARFLVRWLEDGFTAGPVYEAGLEVRF